MIKLKWLLLIGVIAVLYAAGHYMLQYNVILPSFAALEKEEARKDLQRCLDAVQREAHHLSRLASDWAMWDDTYRFVQDRNPEYIESNLEWETLEKASGINLIFICGPSGDIIWGEIHDSEMGGEVRLDEFSENLTSHLPYLFQFDAIQSEHTGILPTAKGPMLLNSRQILTSDGSGPSRGVFIMGRFLHARTFQTLAEQTRVAFQVTDLTLEKIDAAESDIVQRLATETEVIREENAKTLFVYGALKSITGNNALLLKARVPRHIMARGRSVGYLASISLLITLSSIGALLALMFGTYVFGVRRKTALIEALIHERTAELNTAKEAAEEARKIAEKANRSKSDFLANMSHEVRTPLNGIIGMAEAAESLAAEPKLRQMIAVILSAAGSLLKILNDILDFSKIESNKVELENIPFDLRVMMDDVGRTMGDQARRKGLIFETELAADVPVRLMGDPGRLRQVMINLISNAVKFTHTGGVWVRVELLSEQANWFQLRFSVTDSGIGIPKHQQEDIFERFTQADESTTRKYGGTGLGTAICRQIVRLMGGDIQVESEEGKGSVFGFTISLSGAPVETVAPKPVSAKIESFRILVVGGRDAGGEGPAEQLQSLGHHPVCAADTQAALAVLNNPAEGAIDLIVTEYQLGDHGGFELAAHIRSSREWNGIPIMMLTSAGKIGDGKACKETGIQCYLTRPFRLDEMDRAVRMLMDKRHSSGDCLDMELITRFTIAEATRPTVRILLAEDYPANQQVARMHLESAGFQVDVVENGQLAVEFWQRMPYDLILMDVQMPVLDGFGATRAIRELEADAGRKTTPHPDPETGKKAIPIIAMTAHAMIGYDRKCLENGMDDYIPKPFRRAELLAMVNKWLRSGCAGQQTGASPSGDGSEKSSEAVATAPLDFARALEEFMGKRELLLQTLRGFLVTAGEQVEVIRRALHAGSAETIRQEAHKIKGGSANLCAEILSVMARDLEKAAGANELEIVPEIITRMENELKRIEEYLNKRTG
ncbi:MAG: response regulator [Thermodesulfobacteriota bacterium]